MKTISLRPAGRTAAAVAISILVLGLSACVSQSDYEAMLEQNRQLKEQLAQAQAEQNFVEPGWPDGAQEQHRPEAKRL
jgi:hypothetical protein